MKAYKRGDCPRLSVGGNLMRTTEEYRIKLRQIADLAFGDVISSPDVKEHYKTHPKEWGREIQEKFIAEVHEGFRKAQDLLIEEILNYQRLLREKKEILKEQRRQKDFANRQKTDTEIKVINQRLLTFSHIADGIAWQLIGGEIHIARRFHIGEDSSKFLDSSNIEHAKRVADEINRSPLDFALISDLTNFVQIGDILIKHQNIVGIMELKEGKVNDQINEFMSELEKNNQSVTDRILNEKFDEKTVKQAKRMRRQKLRAERVTEIVNKDRGIDPGSEKQIRIFTPAIKTQGYHEEFVKLNRILNTKIWAYTVVENCLHIGLYRDKGIAMAGFAIEEILKIQTDNFIIVDWLSITNNVSQPIFAKPFPPDFIVDVLTGRIKVVLGLNFDILMEVFNILGIETKWLSTKETAKAKQKAIGEEMVVINNRAISMNLPNLGRKMMLSGGVISKILYDNILPSNIALSLLSVGPERE